MSQKAAVSAGDDYGEDYGDENDGIYGPGVLPSPAEQREETPEQLFTEVFEAVCRNRDITIDARCLHPLVRLNLRVDNATPIWYRRNHISHNYESAIDKEVEALLAKGAIEQAQPFA